MPSGSADKVGDVPTARNGSTIEVKNTDAEDRLPVQPSFDPSDTESRHWHVDLSGPVALNRLWRALPEKTRMGWCETFAGTPRRTP
ncbi:MULTISPECIES: hypothetical protein [unclassified Arthrobacter]|uniref:hypothetical protein n=1 Tax=unclassified Arthrobacter TaxID=235627 RepID=UPI002DFB4C9B|nr:hypothetical protein [Arthrobacter sp. MP_M4]MEC5202152.1 hypothetical protein [Arthrobacter sp. MP_M7]